LFNAKGLFGYHWTSDVVIGGALGILLKLGVNLHDQKESRVQVTSLYPMSLSVSLDKMGH